MVPLLFTGLQDYEILSTAQSRRRSIFTPALNIKTHSMKKAIRFALVLIILVIALVLIAGLFAPIDVVVKRSTVIKAPHTAVMEQITHFKNWPAWSPWQEKDTAMKVTYNGDDGSVGSGYHWNGDEKKVGEGEMKNTGVSDTSMSFDIDIIKPWEMHMPGSFIVKDTAGMTKVSWSITKHTSYPFNAANLVVDIDKYMGEDFVLGLGKLKKLLEGNSTTVQQTGPIEIKEVDFPGHIYAGMRQEMSWSEMEQFYMENFGPLGKAIGANVNGPAVSLTYVWDTTRKTADIMAAYPVNDSSTKLKGITYTSVPAGKAYMAVLKGGYSRLKDFHEALKALVARSGKQLILPAIEEYTVSMQQESDTNKLVTNVYYLIK